MEKGVKICDHSRGVSSHLPPFLHIPEPFDTLLCLHSLKIGNNESYKKNLIFNVGKTSSTLHNHRRGIGVPTCLRTNIRQVKNNRHGEVFLVIQSPMESSVTWTVSPQVSIERPAQVLHLRHDGVEFRLDSAQEPIWKKERPGQRSRRFCSSTP